MKNKINIGNANPRMLMAVILILLLGVSLGFLLGIYYTPKQFLQKNQASNQDMTACWEQARKRMTENGYNFNTNTTSPLYVKSITGEITAMASNAITLKTRPMDPLADPALNIKNVEYNGSTKIYKLEKAGNAANSTAKNNYQNKPAVITDIKVGDSVMVTSDANVLESKNILAKEVTLLPSTAPSVKN